MHRGRADERIDAHAEARRSDRVRRSSACGSARSPACGSAGRPARARCSRDRAGARSRCRRPALRRHERTAARAARRRSCRDRGRGRRACCACAAPWRRSFPPACSSASLIAPRSDRARPAAARACLRCRCRRWRARRRARSIAPRSGGGARMTVSLIGEGFGASRTLPARRARAVLIEPVGVGSAMPLSAESAIRASPGGARSGRASARTAPGRAAGGWSTRSTWRAQIGDAILVGELHLRLARDQARQHVVAEGEIGGGRGRPAGHDDQGADDDPERDRPEADLAAGMAERPAGVRPRCGRARVRRADAIGRGLSERTSTATATSTLPPGPCNSRGRNSERRFDRHMVNFPRNAVRICRTRVNDCRQAKGYGQR